ncbi:alpha/beta hydrolase [Muriicola soli]|uniref:Alpha/beta hydrolase n=1 Tax=Muriicola soli TaxID=2507538 RepID=A0A411EAF2_9FLAO|nr:alpha/beta hydrolase [Muriicola soli]QBA64702.1 alpha/beta hydrolase [Muriicola soli]
MKIKILLLLVIVGTHLPALQAQDIAIRKGIVRDSVPVNDSIPETFAIYLPTNFEPSVKWPVLFAMDMEGKGKQIVHMFREIAEKEGYILAASNNIHDSLSIVQNTLVVSRMLNTVYTLFPIHKQRTYTAGHGVGAQFASILPSVIRPIEGVISSGSDVPFKELIDPKNPFEFVGIVGRSDYHFNNLVEDSDLTTITRRALGKSKFVDYLLVFEGGEEWPDKSYLQRAVEILTLRSMSKGNVELDTAYVRSIYNRNFATLNNHVLENDYLAAAFLADEMISKFKGLVDLEELKKRRKVITREKVYSVQLRKQKRYMQKEYFIRGEYDYNLNDDVLTLNYNNLGWWNFQMDEIRKFIKSSDPFEKEMGYRLLGFVNALVEDNIALEKAQDPLNEEALSYLWMVKTITAPKEFKNYLNIISDSSKYEDFGTALFYLEELLKNGYRDKAALYALKNTALLRITPEFNEIIEKYFDDARYDIIEE